MEDNKSEEELAKDSQVSEETEGAEESAKEEVVEEKSEPPAPTVPLQDYTRTKDVLHRIAERILSDENKLNELAEEDPKLLERIKLEFPKKFRDVKTSKHLSEEDIDARIKAEVSKQTKEIGMSGTVESFREELGMKPLEFDDIKSDLLETAEKMMRLELADNLKDAISLAYKNLSPKKHEEMLQKRAVMEVSKRKANANTGTGSMDTNQKIPARVLENYKKLGFKSPEEMLRYKNMTTISIADHVKPKK